jgi:hypothetical protein
MFTMHVPESGHRLQLLCVTCKIIISRYIIRSYVSIENRTTVKTSVELRNVHFRRGEKAGPIYIYFVPEVISWVSTTELSV